MKIHVKPYINIPLCFGVLMSEGMGLLMIGVDANTNSVFQRSLFQTTVSLFFPESMKMIHVSISMFFIYFLSVTLSKNILVKCTRNFYLFSKIYTKKINEFQI